MSASADGALSAALGRAERGEVSDNMQQALDMVEERIRFITQRGAAVPLTDSGMVTALPPELVVADEPMSIQTQARA